MGRRGAPWLPHGGEEEASDGQYSEGGAPQGGCFRYSTAMADKHRHPTMKHTNHTLRATTHTMVTSSTTR